jgi:hypothetical protein
MRAGKPHSDRSRAKAAATGYENGGTTTWRRFQPLTPPIENRIWNIVGLIGRQQPHQNSTIENKVRSS